MATTKNSRAGFSDTHPAAEAVQMECFRKMTPARRCAVMRSLTATSFVNSRRAIEQSHPHLNESERKLFLIELLYGADLASGIRRELQS